jgi:hypothetical protein
MKMKWISASMTMILSAAVHAADFDAAGRLTSVTHDGRILPIEAGLVIDMRGGKSVVVAPSRVVKLERTDFAWRGTVKLPGGTVDLDATWTDIPGKLRFKGALRAAGAKAPAIERVTIVLSVPREMFAGGQIFRVQPEDGGTYRPPVRVPETGTARVLVGELTSGVTFLDARKNWSIGLQLPAPRRIDVLDIGETNSDALRAIVTLHGGALTEAPVPIEFTLSIVGKNTPPPSAASN